MLFFLSVVGGCEAGTPTGDYKTDARRKAALEAFERAEPRSPTVYDWFSLIFFFFHSFRPTIEILKFSDPDKKPHESRKKRKEKKRN